MTTDPLVSIPNTNGTATVLGCERTGHPLNYAHIHPYISALCEQSGAHATCASVGQMMDAPDFCDCECHAPIVSDGDGTAVGQ